jgi:hypothetical protein
MKLRIVLLCSMLVLMASLAGAFPLSGGNGQFNATVLGTYTKGNTIYADIIFTQADGRLPISYGKAYLVDSEDRFYEEGRGDAIGSASHRDDFGADLLGMRRLLKRFEVPSDTAIEIKRLRINPPEGYGSPFSIEWTGVPEVTSGSTTMKFYGMDRKISPPTDPADAISVDIKITNSAGTELKINKQDFVLVDQFGYPYWAAFQHPENRETTLLPGESMRFNVQFSGISKLSRPLYLQYPSLNLTMDISAWA